MRTTKEKGITFGVLSITVISMATILVLALIKIYLSNQIYYESKKINSIEAEVAALREENSLLQISVEQLSYKNKIADTIFDMESAEE